MQLNKVKDKQDFINAISQAIKEIDEVIKDSANRQNEGWYWDMMAIRPSMAMAKIRHK